MTAHIAKQGRLYGTMPVLEALRAGNRTLERIILAHGIKSAKISEIVAHARKAHIPIAYQTRSDLSRLIGSESHQGVAAFISAYEYADLEKLLDSLFDSLKPHVAHDRTYSAPLLVVLDGVEDPRNLGAIIRTAECAGADAVIIPERRAVGLTETVVKASAGALEHVPVARVQNLVRLIDDLKQRGIWTIGIEAGAPQTYDSWDMTLPVALIFGSEGKGIHRLLRERCDILLSIPLNGRLNSLNVSVATGISLYEAVRQRRRAHEDH